MWKSPKKMRANRARWHWLKRVDATDDVFLCGFESATEWIQRLIGMCQQWTSLASTHILTLSPPIFAQAHTFHRPNELSTIDKMNYANTRLNNEQAREKFNWRCPLNEMQIDNNPTSVVEYATKQLKYIRNETTINTHTIRTLWLAIRLDFSLSACVALNSFKSILNSIWLGFVRPTTMRFAKQCFPLISVWQLQTILH